MDASSEFKGCSYVYSKNNVCGWTKIPQTMCPNLLQVAHGSCPTAIRKREYFAAEKMIYSLHSINSMACGKSNACWSFEAMSVEKLASPTRVMRDDNYESTKELLKLNVDEFGPVVSLHSSVIYVYWSSDMLHCSTGSRWGGNGWTISTFAFDTSRTNLSVLSRTGLHVLKYSHDLTNVHFLPNGLK